MTKGDFILFRRKYWSKFKSLFSKDEPTWLKKSYALVGAIGAIASVYFAWLSIKLVTSDHTQEKILLKQDTVLQALILQNKKLDTSIFELKNQNKQLSDQFSLIIKRYNFDSLNVDRGTKKDYLNLKYALTTAWQNVSHVIFESDNNPTIFRKSAVDSLQNAIDNLHSQQDNNIFLDNEKVRLKWINYQSAISSFITISLRYNSQQNATGDYVIKNPTEFANDLDSLRTKNGKFFYDIGTFISKRINVVKSLQMPAKQK